MQHLHFSWWRFAALCMARTLCMKRFLPGFFLLCAFVCPAREPQWAQPPRLVVGIVVDQMRVDLLYRYWDGFGQGGFKRMVRQGSFWRHAQYPYLPTVTGPGHASVYTGAPPAYHGIVANEPFDRHTGTLGYCVQDPTSIGVGTESPSGQRSPVQLLATTLADELELHTGGAARTVAIALKDRSAILPAGRMGDAAYWYIGGTEGRWVSASWYMEKLPSWCQDFNAQGLPERYLDTTWNLLLPRSRYHEMLPDNNRYEAPLPKAQAAVLPLRLDSLRQVGATLDLIAYTPFGNTLTTEMAIAACKGEGLGMDAITDLLAVSYSSTDILGHKVGVRALELEDMYLRLDRELERLFEHLDRSVGKGRYTVFLTADHGATDVPALLKDRKASAGYVHYDTLRFAVERALHQAFGGGPWVQAIANDQLFLDQQKLRADQRDVAHAARIAAETIRQYPGLAHVLTAQELLAPYHTEPLAAAMQRGFFAPRSGDVCWALLPGHIEWESHLDGKGTTHGSGWNYDTHVPVILFGQGVRKGSVLRPTRITDIAPTVALLCGMALPNAASGAPVPESLRPER
jgi:predicted AlkP superfamily pyrophosphatase or phosphodiesterase